MGLDRALFDEEVEEDFLCRLCHQVLLNPVTSGCKHVFCQACVIRKMKSRTTRHVCPVCSSALSLDMSDTPVDFKLKLLNLSIKCAHKCGDSFALSELPDHMDVCPFAPVPCDFKEKGCKRTIKRCDKTKHCKECDYREVECEACGFHTIYCELFTHQSRVRCLERKLKQQVIRERKAASREISRHREKLSKDTTRLELQQRRKQLTHAMALTSRKQERQITGSSNSNYSNVSCDITRNDEEMNGGVFLTENVLHEHDRATMNEDTTEQPRMVRRL